MPRIYLTLIILSVLIAIFFSESEFFFVEKNLVFLEKEIILSEPIILTGLSVTILSILLMLNLAEKTYDLFVRNKKSKKKEMAVKKKSYYYLRFIDSKNSALVLKSFNLSRIHSIAAVSSISFNNFLKIVI